MHKAVNPLAITLGPQGRVVIPVELRRQMEIQPGDTLSARVEDQRLILEKRSAILERLRQRFAHIPVEVSLSDELISERRAEAHQE